jgi:hypothetical protein
MKGAASAAGSGAVSDEEYIDLLAKQTEALLLTLELEERDRTPPASGLPPAVLIFPDHVAYPAIEPVRLARIGPLVFTCKTVVFTSSKKKNPFIQYIADIYTA